MTKEGGGGGAKGGQNFLASVERNEEILHLKEDMKMANTQE